MILKEKKNLKRQFGQQLNQILTKHKLKFNEVHKGVEFIVQGHNDKMVSINCYNFAFWWN